MISEYFPASIVVKVEMLKLCYIWVVMPDKVAWIILNAKILQKNTI